ncbi:MAG: sulfatase-like hydrolase/transferase [Wenzhouxiangella sp.]
MEAKNNQAFGLKKFFLEITAWLALTSAFALIYSSNFRDSALSLEQHWHILWLILVAFFSMRIILAKIAGPIATKTCALLTPISMATLGIYYCLVIISLSNWNQVISWNLIVTYVDQLGDFIDVLGWSSWLTVTITLTVIALLLAISFWSREIFAWPQDFARAVPRTGILLLAVTLTISLSQIQFHFSQPAYQSKEPFRLTFTKKNRPLQNHRIDPLHFARVSGAERRARQELLSSEAISPRNIIVIVVDGLRPDHMSINGYDRETTPRLDSRCQSSRFECVSFDDAYSVCGESFCGIQSILSSRYVHNLTLQPLSIQEVLQQAGFKSKLILSGDHTNVYGLRDTYGEVDLYHDGSLSNRFMNDDELVIDKLKLLPESDGSPRFFYLHFMSAHLLGTRFVDFRFTPERRYGISGFLAAGDGQRRSNPVLNFYDNGVYQTDSYIARSLDILDDKGFLDNAIVVITSDHGEFLGEHGLFGHAKSAFAPGLRVPIVMMFVDSGPRHPIDVNQTVSLVDIAPSLLFELGLSAPNVWEGKALQGTGDRPWILFQQGAEIGLVDSHTREQSFKYWINFSSGEEFLFDMANDPEQMRNLADGQQPMDKWRETIKDIATLQGLR